MKKLYFVLASFLLLGTVCLAQQAPGDAPASKEDIERYFQVMHVRETMKVTMDAVVKQVRQMSHERMQKDAPNLPPEVQARIDKMLDEMFKDFPVEELLQTMVPVYQKHMTKNDIDAVVAFYSTPTGKKLLKELPAMLQESMQASSALIRARMDQAMQRVQVEIAQMRKDAEAKSKKQSPTSPNE
jgi:hypothetical protein